MSGTDASDLTGQPSDRRRLIVVVHADVVGYSRLIGLRIPERPRASDVGTPPSVKAKRGRRSISRWLRSFPLCTKEPAIR
jgi:hypothetical protein